MTQFGNLPNRVDRLENDNIDIKLAVSSLIETVSLHQRNFETIVTEMRRDRELNQSRFEATMAEIHQMQANFDRTQASIEQMQSNLDQMQANIQGLQTENRRLFDHLFGEQNTDEDTI